MGQSHRSEFLKQNMAALTKPSQRQLLVSHPYPYPFLQLKHQIAQSKELRMYIVNVAALGSYIHSTNISRGLLGAEQYSEVNKIESACVKHLFHWGKQTK